MVRIVSEWKRIVEYPENHLNDFCMFKWRDRWHAVGITGDGTWESETRFFHCSSAHLFGPYEKHESLLRDLEQGAIDNKAPQKHAPFVVERDGLLHMFFRRPWGTNLLLVSPDPFEWPAKPILVFEENDARDACIKYFNGAYYWYYCQYLDVDGRGRSCILCRTSSDLRLWSDAVAVHIDTSREVGHSLLESPYVVYAKGRYWLFVRDRSQDDVCGTTVFVSDRPDAFPCGERAWCAVLPDVHAPELVEEDGRCYIVRVSGYGFPGRPERGGWLEIAELAFDDSQTSRVP